MGLPGSKRSVLGRNRRLKNLFGVHTGHRRCLGLPVAAAVPLVAVWQPGFANAIGLWRMAGKRFAPWAAGLQNSPEKSGL
jgi:hypothetical protein